jgi:hypothetical protein
VSISVVGLMTEPGSGYDNYDANDAKVENFYLSTANS